MMLFCFKLFKQLTYIYIYIYGKKNQKVVVLFYDLKTHALVIFCPFVASGEKPKAFFLLTEIMPFKFDYILNFYNIYVQNSNFVFQPFWQPYCEFEFIITFIWEQRL